MAIIPMNVLKQKDRKKDFETCEAEIKLLTVSRGKASAPHPRTVQLKFIGPEHYIPIELTPADIERILPTLLEYVGEEAMKKLVVDHLAKLTPGSLIEYAAEVLAER